MKKKTMLISSLAIMSLTLASTNAAMDTTMTTQPASTLEKLQITPPQQGQNTPVTIVINTEKKDDKPGDPEKKKLELEKLRAEINKLNLEGKKSLVDMITLKTVLGALIIAAASSGIVLGKEGLIKILSQWIVRPAVQTVASTIGHVAVDAAVSVPSAFIAGASNAVGNELMQTQSPLRRICVLCGLATGATTAFNAIYASGLYIIAVDIIQRNQAAYTASMVAGLLAAGAPYMCNIPGISSLSQCAAR